MHQTSCSFLSFATHVFISSSNASFCVAFGYTLTTFPYIPLAKCMLSLAIAFTTLVASRQLHTVLQRNINVASAWHFGTFCASMHSGSMLHSMYLLGLHMYHKRSHGGIANKTLLFVGKRMCWIILQIVVIWVFHFIYKSKWVLWVRYGCPLVLLKCMC